MSEGFEGLLVWKKAHALMLFAHQQIVPCLPAEEKWDLTSQIRRSSKSIPSNIAEGYGRFYYRDRIGFCYHARGSLCETQNHMIEARDLKYISEQLYSQGRQMSDEVYRLLNGYIDYLKKEKPGKDEPGHDIAAPPPCPDP